MTTTFHQAAHQCIARGREHIRYIRAGMLQATDYPRVLAGDLADLRYIQAVLYRNSLASKSQPTPIVDPYADVEALRSRDAATRKAERLLWAEAAQVEKELTLLAA